MRIIPAPELFRGFFVADMLFLIHRNFLMKTLLILSCSFLFSGNLVAEGHLLNEQAAAYRPKQKKEKKEAHYCTVGSSAKGNFLIQPSLDLGHHLGFGKNYSALIPDHAFTGLVPGLTLNLDYNVHDYLSVGVFYSVAFQNYNANHVLYLGHAVGERTSFHWWQLLDDKSPADLRSNKIDLDLHVHLGAYIMSEKDKLSGYKYHRYGFNAGAGMGLKYYFVPNFGVFIDGGYEETSFAKLGIVFKT